MRKLKILLVGQPNVGKSSLLNALVGPKVTVSNYPGTTVEVTRAAKVFGDTKISFDDTPGIYSISDRSEEEKITERALFEQEADGAIVVVDSTSLERSLYLALQVLEAGIPTVLALNFVEDAEKRGIKVDHKKLGRLLNVSVVPINPQTKKGMDRLINALLKMKKAKRRFTVRYDDDIEEAIERVSPQVVKTPLPKRFVALRILEGDPDFYKYLKDERVIEEAKAGLEKHPKVAEDISVTRYGTAAFIAEEVTELVPLKERRRLEERVDKVLLHDVWGPLSTLLIFFTLFGVLFFLGSLVQSTLMGLTERVLSSIPVGDSIVALVSTQALYGVAAGVSIALPYVFLFYLLLGLMEDTGLLPRFVVNLERFFRAIGLPGKSFIPLSLGLGCTVPAVKATRVLSSQEEKFCTASLFTCMPCSSRIGIIMGIVGFYGGIPLALSVFATLLVAGLIWAFMARKLACRCAAPLLQELPPYRKPLIENIVAKSWIRMKDFVYIVIPLLAVGGIVYAILDMTGTTGVIVGPLSPVARWLGLPTITVIPLVFGFLQKDLTGAMLLSVLGTQISSVLTPLQIYTFGVATTIQIPCIIALGMLIREFGFKKAAFLTGASITYGFLFAGLVWRIVSLL